MAESKSESSWFAVRCVLALHGIDDVEDGQVYEERITLWHCTSLDAAIVIAEAEAQDYAAATPENHDVYLDFAQAYALAEIPGHGAEVFSLLRTSDLAPGPYLDTFFDTGRERQGDWPGLEN